MAVFLASWRGFADMHRETLLLYCHKSTILLPDHRKMSPTNVHERNSWEGGAVCWQGVKQFFFECLSFYHHAALRHYAKEPWKRQNPNGPLPKQTKGHLRATPTTQHNWDKVSHLVSHSPLSSYIVYFLIPPLSFTPFFFFIHITQPASGTDLNTTSCVGAHFSVPVSVQQGLQMTDDTDCLLRCCNVSNNKC